MKMFIDIVKPENNEADMFRMAERLGIKSLALYYDKPKSLFDIQRETHIKLYTAGISKADILIRSAGDKSKAHMVWCPSQPLKHFFYKELAKSGVAILYPLSPLIESEGERKVSILENFMRHIKLCRKHKVKIVVASFASDPYFLRAESDIKSLLLSLGMDTRQAKDALDWTEILNKN